jgi:hypothetical protein
MYSSIKFENNLENILRISQKDFFSEKKEITNQIPLPKSDLPKPTKLKFAKTIRLKNPLNGSKDISTESFTPNRELKNVNLINNNNETESRVFKKSSSEIVDTNSNNVFNFSKIITSKLNTNRNHSPGIYFEEDSTKINSSKATPDNTRFTPNSLRSERSSSRKYQTPPDSAKLPTICTTRGKKDYDINNIMNVANDFKEDPLIKKKLHDIYQNIEDIKKVLNQKSKTRIKISSAPVSLDGDNTEFLFKDKLVKNKLVYNQKIKLNNVGPILKAFEKDKCPIKLVRK